MKTNQPTFAPSGAPLGETVRNPVEASGAPEGVSFANTMKNTPEKASANQRPKPYSKGWIYVFWMESTDFYKVGWVKTYRNIQPRIARLQTGNPFNLKCVACFQGTLQDESKLHWSMTDSRVGFSEWFETNPELEKLIAENPYEQ